MVSAGGQAPHSLARVRIRLAVSALAAVGAIACSAPEAQAESFRSCGTLYWKDGIPLSQGARGVTCKFARVWIKRILRGEGQPRKWSCNRSEWPEVYCRRGQRAFRSYER